MFSSINLDHNNNNDQDVYACTKRRGASLVRSDFNRQNSLNNSAREQLSKRNSILDPSKAESNSTGGTKLMNFFKSGLHLSKFKSKSKANLLEKRQSLYIDSHSSKSEENLMGSEFDSYFTAIRANNLVLNMQDPTLYTTTLTADGESIYKPVVVLDRDCAVQTVHPSIITGQQHCFQIIKRPKSEITASHTFHSISINRDSFETSQITKSCSYNSPFTELKSAPRSACESVKIIRCSSVIQRNEWIMRIKKHINPNIEKTVRHEDTLKIWIQEAKNLTPKKKYFCEIKLDQVLYGRTTIKIMNDTVFWGEEFQFSGLETVDVISVSIYRIIDLKRQREKPELIAQINLSCGDILQNSFTEKWYSPSPDIRASSDHLRYSHSITLHTNIQSLGEVSKSIVDSTPMLRVKARYRPLEILPIRCYQPLIEYLFEDNVSLVMSLESHLKVKSKEDLVNSLIPILQNKDKHIQFLSDIVKIEVLKSDENLVLRGNTMASKSIECYLKIIGEKYLHAVLSDMIEQVTTKEIDCEVDPLRISNPRDQSIIVNNQKKLMMLVEGVWFKIVNSSHFLPKDLKSVFSIIREKMCNSRPPFSNSSSMADQVISSCLFLRFICPAIMSPFLFGLANEYSDKLCINRTFTLVAKCIQSLANLSNSNFGKETYMGFLHDFLTKHTNQMRNFLKQISSNSARSELTDIQDKNLYVSELSVDLGYQLAELSYQLSFHLRDIQRKEYTPALTKVRMVLENISKFFPNLDRERDIATSLTTFRSQIPVPLHRNISSLSSIIPFERNFSVLSSIPCSPIPKTDCEEDFSYIPNKYSSIVQPDCKEGIFKLGNENYVDFESIDMKVYDEPYFEDASTNKPCLLKFLNEKEINDHWTKVVNESYNKTVTPDSDPVYANNNTTISSGYESLNLPPISQDGPELCSFQSIPAQSPQTAEDQLSSASQPTNSPKIAPVRKPNIYRRIKRTSLTCNAQSSVAVDTKSSDQTKLSTSNLSLTCDMIGSLDTLSNTDNHSLQLSKSMSSVCQKKGLNQRSNLSSFNTDRHMRDNTNSRDNIDSSMVKLFRNSSKSLSNSISSNVDLDSFVTNELTRLQLFFEYFQIQKPSMYQGNAVEQYKYKTLDENNLKRALVKKPHLNHIDIANHIKSSYRLLKTINKPGQLTADFIVKSVMQINYHIQLIVQCECQQTQPLHNNSADCYTQSDLVKSKKRDSRNQDSLDMSIRSLPSPLSKYSKQSLRNSVSSANRCESNSSVNLSKGLTVHDIFEHY